MSTSSNSQTIKDIKLPEFSLADPEFWFDAVDEMFSIGEISDDEKYACVKSHLSSNPLKWLVEELPADTASGNKYPELRKRVLSRIIQEQLENIELVELFTCGDLKPSVFLQHLTVVTNDVIPKSIRRTIWLARLPRRIQKMLFIAILSDSEPMEDRSLESLAAVADGIAAYEKYHSFPVVKTKPIMYNLPPYDQKDPEIWFYLLDEAFSSNDVTDEELKYEYTVSAMRSQDLFTAALFLTDLPNRTTHNQYIHLRDRIIKTFVTIHENKTYRFVFRNMENFKPSQYFKFLHDMASKSNRFIPQVLVRTLWIMQLPIEAQAVLFQLMLTSNESIQDMNMNVLSAVADRVAGSKKKDSMKNLIAYLRGPSLESKEVNMEVFQIEMQQAVSLEHKIALGKRHCDYMYKVYYDKTSSESVDSCILYNQDYTAKDLFHLGCTCWYHQCYKEDAYRCLQLI